MSMTRRIPVQELRGSDKTLLEVQLPSLLHKPMGQIAPINMLDVIELAMTEDRPESLADDLDAFVISIQRQIKAIPTGPSWDEFLAEVAEIDATLIPTRFRQMLRAETERPERNAVPIVDLLERWSATEPYTFTFGERAVKVQHAAAVEPRVPSAAPKEKAAKAGAKSKTKAKRTTKAGVDPERLKVLEQLCMERLNQATEKGLGEVVLIAGIRHHAKSQLGHVTPAEVTTALKGLKLAGRVRYSARRWASMGRW